MTFHVEKFNGEPIAKAGLYSGVPNEHYHGSSLCDGPSVSSTGLRTITAKSPAHYWATSPYNPKPWPSEDNEALAVGRAAHHALLGESEFGKHFVVRPANLGGQKWNSNRNDCKDWLSAAANTGLTVITPDQRDRIIGMRDALAAHPMIDPKGGICLLDGLVEHTIVWREPKTGVWLKVRPDVIPLDSDDAVDLKTTKSVDGRDIISSVANFSYHMQGALVSMAWKAVFGRPIASFTLVFVEKTPPFCVRIVSLKPHDLELGERQAMAALRQFKACMDSGVWPGPGDTQDAEYIELPDWARTRAENRIVAIEEGLAA